MGKRDCGGKMEKQVLKPLWHQCIRELIEQAGRNNQIEIDISVKNIRDRGKQISPNTDVNRPRSICWAKNDYMGKDDHIANGIMNSTTYTIRYKVKRIESIVKEEKSLNECINQNSKKLPDKDKSENYFKQLSKVFNDLEYAKQCLNKCEKDYRLDDEGRIFYKAIVSYPSDKFNSNYIKCVYSLLKKWNMDQQRAKLSELNVFIKSIIDNSDTLRKISEQTLMTLEESTIKTLSDLFEGLNLVQTKSPLVTFSKTLHFFLPNLVMPIDRKYTCDFFNIHPNVNSGKEKETQLDIFISLLKAISKFSRNNDLSRLIDPDSDWNLNIPKIIDNMIIGHKKLKGT